MGSTIHRFTFASHNKFRGLPADFGPQWKGTFHPANVIAYIAKAGDICPEPMTAFISYISGANSSKYNEIRTMETTGCNTAGYYALSQNDKPSSVAARVALALMHPSLFEFASVHNLFNTYHTLTQEARVEQLSTQSPLIKELVTSSVRGSKQRDTLSPELIYEGPLRDLALLIHEKIEREFGQKVQVQPFTQDMHETIFALNTEIFKGSKFLGRPPFHIINPNAFESVLVKHLHEAGVNPGVLKID